MREFPPNNLLDAFSYYLFSEIIQFNRKIFYDIPVSFFFIWLGIFLKIYCFISSK